MRSLVLGAVDLVTSAIGNDRRFVVGEVRIPFVVAVAFPFAFSQLHDLPILN